AGANEVIPVMPVAETIKSGADDTVVDTPDRTTLRAVQTPPAFDLASLRAANEKYFSSSTRTCVATDDASLMEWYGQPVTTVDGDPMAFKITTPLDLPLANAVLTESLDKCLPRSHSRLFHEWAQLSTPIRSKRARNAGSLGCSLRGMQDAKAIPMGTWYRMRLSMPYSPPPTSATSALSWGSGAKNTTMFRVSVCCGNAASSLNYMVLPSVMRPRR